MRLALGCLFVLAVAAARPVGAESPGHEVLARARTVEREQLAALAGTTLQMRTRGTVRDGQATHTYESERHLAVALDGSIHNDFAWGRFDGRPFDEAGLRKATGAPPKPPRQAEALTVALTPLSAADVEVQPVGPVADGGYLLRCKVRREAVITALEVVVDAASGKKRSARLRPAGAWVHLVDKADMALTYADDGTPAELRSLIAARVLWVDRTANFVTTRQR
jgi:hypothetical protein